MEYCRPQAKAPLAEPDGMLSGPHILTTITYAFPFHDSHSPSDDGSRALYREKGSKLQLLLLLLLHRLLPSSARI